MFGSSDRSRLREQVARRLLTSSGARANAAQALRGIQQTRAAAAAAAARDGADRDTAHVRAAVAGD